MKTKLFICIILLALIPLHIVYPMFTDVEMLQSPMYPDYPEPISPEEPVDATPFFSLDGDQTVSASLIYFGGKATNLNNEIWFSTKTGIEITVSVSELSYQPPEVYPTPPLSDYLVITSIYTVKDALFNQISFPSDIDSDTGSVEEEQVAIAFPSPPSQQALSEEISASLLKIQQDVNPQYYPAGTYRLVFTALENTVKVEKIEILHQTGRVRPLTSIEIPFPRYWATITLKARSVPELLGGSIKSNTPQVLYGASAGLISNVTAPSGGEGSYTYQWEQSTPGSTWRGITGATGLTYSTPSLTEQTSYRRKVTSKNQTAYSNVVTIKVVSSDLGTDQNYIQTRTMQNESGTVYQDKIDYYDGLGRPVQSVMRGNSPTRKDIATLQEYDGAGRPSNSYIPVPMSGSTGSYVAPGTLKTASNNFYGDAHAYEKLVYEPSPLNRVKEQYGPGSSWHSSGKGISTDWQTNSGSGSLACGLYVVATATSLQRKGLYSGGELYVTKTTDEDGQVAYTFTDKLGQLILERVMNGTDMNDTYYVYDDFGNLCYVLPPGASTLLSGASTWPDTHETLNDHAYIYKYDGRNRCIRKKLPGCSAVDMRYDKGDRLIFSQDGNRRAKGEWMFHLYDAFSRPVVTGIWASGTVPDVSGLVVKSSRNPQDLKLGGYTVSNLSLPSTVKLLTVNYYDDYSFISGMAQLDYATPPSGYGTRHSSAKGQPTGSRAYRLDDPSKYTVSAVYYDHRRRVVQTHSTNHLGGYDHEYTGYTFTGKVTQRMQVHTAPNKTTQTEVYAYSYDHAERLLSVTHKLNSAARVTLAQYTYDEVGRAKTKKLGTETTTYSYNVRGWLNRISGTKFNQTLAYNTAVNGVTPSTPRYNGNISAMRWKSGDETTERGYQFTYDNLSRLTLAKYGEGTNITTNPDRFNEKLTYDKIGNITTLERQGKLDGGYGLMDKLSYTYTGNRLTKVTDAVSPSITYANVFQFVDRANVANEYAYDANGNLTKDLNKNITSITYNSLNLPSVITFTNGNTITYVYDASGSKLSVAYKSGSTTTKTEYSGNKVYKNGTLSMILTEDGFATLSGTAPTYYYYLKDHQGNNRVVINQSGTVQQVNHYYAFGGQFGEGMQSSNQPYKYNGKELDRFQGLDLYDYGARHYDAALGRWFTVDPMAEKYYSISSYVYVANNPVRFIDPTGMWIDDYSVNIKGHIELLKRTGDEKDKLIALGKNNKIEFDNNGNMTNSFFTVDKDILNNQKKTGETTYMFVKGDEQAEGMFKFLSENTMVEWGRLSYGKSSNYLSTNNDANDNGIEIIAYDKLFKNGKVNLIKSIDHSHPNLDYIEQLPSGFPATPMRYGGGDGDKGFAEWLYKYYPKDASRIQLRVYRTNGQGYIRFDNRKIYNK